MHRNRQKKYRKLQKKVHTKYRKIQNNTAKIQTNTQKVQKKSAWKKSVLVLKAGSPYLGSTPDVDPHGHKMPESDGLLCWTSICWLLGRPMGL